MTMTDDGGLGAVLALFDRFGVTPTPDNYRLWYAYSTGESAELCAEVDALIATRAPFTQTKQDELRQRHLSPPSAESQAGGRIAGILSELVSDLSSLDTEADRYGEALSGHLEKVQAGGGLNDLEALLEVLAGETRRMRASTQELRQDFARRSDEIAQIQAELQKVKLSANSDPLTGLLNRRALVESLNRLDERRGQRHSLLMLDIDHFKAINDEHGHLIGDKVIRFVADVIRKHTRGQDTPCRFGGEEFAILLPETHLAGALTVAEKIRAVVSAAKLVRSTNQVPIGQITLSGGVATYRPGEDAMEMLDRADRALYLAKDRGRNRIIPETEV